MIGNCLTIRRLAVLTELFAGSVLSASSYAAEMQATGGLAEAPARPPDPPPARLTRS